MPGTGDTWTDSWLTRSAVVYLVLFCVFAAAFGAASAQPLDRLEDERLLKAVFVFNFAKFTHWPDDTWESREAPLILCIAGTDELAITLERLVGEMVGGRPVAIRPYAEGSADQACNLLYIGGSEHSRFVGLIQQMKLIPVLTISQIRGFADRGGMIQLYRDKDRIRFKINVAAARANGLQLSARLLDLAEVVGNGVTP
jgi:hypothetical protein